MSARTMTKKQSKKHLSTLTLTRRRTHQRKRAEGDDYRDGTAYPKPRAVEAAANWRRKKK